MAHVNLGKQHPAAYKSVLALNEEVEEAVARAGLDAKLAELVKVRTSQLTGCAFCLRMHTRDALDKGETTDRLAVLAAWWESQYFTEHERAALAEDVTHHTRWSRVGQRITERRAGLRDHVAHDRHERVEPHRRPKPLPRRSVTCAGHHLRPEDLPRQKSVRSGKNNTCPTVILFGSAM